MLPVSIRTPWTCCSNMIGRERAVLIGDRGRITTGSLLLEDVDRAAPSALNLEVKAGCTVRQMEKKLIFRTLREVDDNRTQAAELLGISIRTLRNKLQEYKQTASGAG